MMRRKRENNRCLSPTPPPATVTLYVAHAKEGCVRQPRYPPIIGASHQSA